MILGEEEVGCRVRRRYTVHGMVQGVGFRPFVHALALELGLAGHVHNSGGGVVIEIEGVAAIIDSFHCRLWREAPPHSKIESIEEDGLVPKVEAGFAVRPTAGRASPALRVPPDLAVCADCLEEVSNPADRRYGYPFTNCTRCGPRYTIIERMPYERTATSMRGFDLCPDCAREFCSPADRRFHAEPVACPFCGPRLRFMDGEGREICADADAIAEAAKRLKGGACIAVKGIGGFHLLVDACAQGAVLRVRERKGRPTKPLAVMVASIARARNLASLHPAEESLLASPAAPIVLAAKKPTSALARAVAPGCRDIGLLLAYTPLHHLLLERFGGPLVATSANRSGEPIVWSDEMALAALGGIADCFLVHDRPIVRPLDDSVMRMIGGHPQVLRLGRGLAPGSIDLAGDVADGPAVLGLGGHLKAAPVLLSGGRAILGPHVGDLESLAAEQALLSAATGLEALQGCRAQILACDQHPDYATTRLAQGMDRRIIAVQHHVAHIAAVMAEHELEGPVLGIAWDGTGHGADGTVWGGEILEVGRGAWRRVGHLRPFRLPGGERAVREPRRAALGLLHELGEDPCVLTACFEPSQIALLIRLLETGVGAPLTSSMGRLFDGCAALLGLCAVSGHEGQAAMALEALADEADEAGGAPIARPYPFEIVQSAGEGPWEIDWRPMVRGILAKRAQPGAAPAIAARFHLTLAAMIEVAADRSRLGDVVLSGGCFQNRRLTEESVRGLERAGKRVYFNRLVPPGDGGLALGQAVWARWCAAMEA